MIGIFIELYLDEDVDVLIASLLRARGFEVSTTVEEGNRGKTDAEQLEHAVRLGRTLLTHNRVDFEALAEAYHEEGKSHPGIILAVRRSPYEVTQRLLIILNAVTADEMVDQVRYI